jgi:hypothetical protein
MAAFLKGVIKTYTLFVGADWMSNFVLHPTQKLDYGQYINKLIKRPEGPNAWWGTKTEHIVTIPLPLAVFDVGMAMGLAKWCNKGVALNWRTSPGLSLFHAIGFAFGGIMTYVYWNAYMNPALKDDPAKQTKFINDHWCPIAAGSATMSTVGPMAELLAPLSRVGGPHGFVLQMIVPAYAFCTVKGLGTGDVGNRTLTPFEKELNGLVPAPVVEEVDMKEE